MSYSESAPSLLFIHSPSFDRSMNGVLTDDDLRDIQDAIRARPQSGAVIPGTSGVRKMRWGVRGSGKSDGVRVLYLVVPQHERIYMILVYSKGQKENITETERKQIRYLADALKAEA